MKKISEINDSIKTVSLFARIEKSILSTGSNGSNYLIVHLVDKTGRVEARLWNAEEKDKEALKIDKVVKIDANVNVYRQQLQLKVNSYQIIEESQFELNNITNGDFEVSAPINVESNYEKLIGFMSEIKNSTYKDITISLLTEFKEKFKSYPAAMSIHHNVVGGLFWHSMSLFMCAKGIKPVYEKYENIDWELVFCGAVLHDIGKVVEMNGKNGTDYTLEGKLLGHISIGNSFIVQKAIELNIYKDKEGLVNEDVVKMQHAILSSHGKNEYGSPVEPVMIEGVIISSLDALDARIYKVNDELDKIPVKNWTARIPSEDGKMFYKHLDTKKVT